MLGAGLTTLLCSYATAIGQSLGVMDIPTGESGHKRHASATPAVGGLISAAVASVIFFTSLSYSSPPYTGRPFDKFTFFAVVLANMLVGFLDDKKHIPASKRLFFGTISSAFLLLMIPELQVHQVSFPSISLTFSTGIFALPFTILCLLALKNAVNMADGRNGLLLGMSIIWNTFFLFHALPQMIPSLLAILACLVVLFHFNWRGKLFMGDCGSYGIATYFGILTLYLHKDTFGTVRSAEVILLFLVPVIDTARLIIVRLANGQSPLSPDGQHFHHLLEKAFGWKRGWAIYMALIIAPLIIYQILAGQGVPIILAATAIYALLVWLCTVRIRSAWPTNATAA